MQLQSSSLVVPNFLSPGATPADVTTLATLTTMSRRLATNRPSLPPLPVATSSSDGPNAPSPLLLLTHMPPMRGTVSVSPPSGRALLDPFLLSTQGWLAWDAPGAEEAIFGSSPAFDVARAVSGTAPIAQWMAGTVPLSDTTACAIAAQEARPLRGASVLSGMCELSFASLAAGRASETATSALRSSLRLTAAPPSITAPIWLLQLSLASKIAAGTSGALTASAMGAVCDEVAAWSSDVSRRSVNASAAAVVSVNASRASGLLYSFSQQLDGIVPPLLNPLTADFASILSAGPVLREVGSWPGTPISALSTRTANISTTLAVGSDGRSNSNSSDNGNGVVQITVVGDNNATVGIFVFALDTLGAVGVAFTPVVVSLPLKSSESSNAATVGSFAAALAAQGLSDSAISANPFAALITATAVGSALSGASSASVGTGAATLGSSAAGAADSLLAQNTATRSTAIFAIAAAASNIIVGNSNSSGAVRLGDNVLGLIVGGLGSLTGDPKELSSNAGVGATAFLASALLVSEVYERPLLLNALSSCCTFPLPLLYRLQRPRATRVTARCPELERLLLSRRLSATMCSASS